MRKTTLYLPDDLKDSVARMAAEQDRSEADVIREALREAVQRQARPRPRVPLLATALDDPTLVERVDELLDGFGRD